VDRILDDYVLRGTAIAATVDAFALALFDKTDVAVYDGSLMEWTVDPELPMTDPSTVDRPPA
jgi:3-mercaptopyruvate sulfurtransferase SseA